MKLLFVDTEYSHPDCLLTGALVVFEYRTNKVVDSYQFGLKYDTYLVNVEALQVNRIDILEHDKVALGKEQIEHEIKQFLKKHSTVITPPMIDTKKLIAVGHGIRGDIKQIKANFPNCKWNEYVKSNPIDTVDLYRYKQVFSGEDLDNSISLQSLAKGVKYEAHTAFGDCIANIKILKDFDNWVIGHDC